MHGPIFEDSVGQRLETCRMLRGLAVPVVADEVAISEADIVAIEVDCKDATVKELRALARMYQVKVAWLLGEDPVPPLWMTAVVQSMAGTAAPEALQGLMAEDLHTLGAEFRAEATARPPAAATVDERLALLLNWLQDKGLSRELMARLLGIGSESLQAYMDAQWEAPVFLLTKLGKVMGIPLRWFASGEWERESDWQEVVRFAKQANLIPDQVIALIKGRQR